MILLISILSLLLGPLIYYLSSNSQKALNFIDGLVFSSISILLLIHLLELNQSDHIILCAIAFIVGIFLPGFLENKFKNSKRNIHTQFLILSVFGLIIHSFADGIVLNNYSNASALSLAIIIHNFPVGLAIWWLIKPSFGYKIASITLITMSLFTVIGYFLNFDLSIKSVSLELLQAFIAGSILHVIFYRVHLNTDSNNQLECCSLPNQTNYNYAEGFGSLLGIALVLLAIVSKFDFAQSHSHHNLNIFYKTFYNLFLTSAPALLIAYILSIFIKFYLNFKITSWLSRGSKIKQIAKGIAFGLPLPVCSCGVLPLYQSIVKKGVAPAAGLAFLIATPELGLDAILISFPLLGTKLTLVRLMAAIILAFLVAILLSSFLEKNKSSALNLETIAEEKKVTVKSALKFGLIELVDSTAPWIILGLVIAAVAEPMLFESTLNYPYGIDIILVSIIGCFVYVCASGATPIVAILLAKGLSPGAAICFLLTGPATNISTFGILKSVHGKKFSILFAGTVITVTIMLGFIINLLYSSFDLKSNMHAHGEHFLSYHYLAAIVITILFLYSILRQGSRKFFSELAG